MPFNPAQPYGVATQQVQHQSVPPKGRHVVSADFAIVYIGNVAVGMVQRFSPRETRGVMPQYELGNIYPVEFVPSVWAGEIEVARLDLFKDSLFDAFQYNQMLNNPNFVDLANYWPSNKLGPLYGNGSVGNQLAKPVITTIADIQWPLDIQVQITNPAPETNNLTVKTYLECWVTGYQTTYDAGAKVVSENVTFVYRNAMIQESAIVSPTTFQGAA